MTLGVNHGLESNNKITIFIVNKFATNTTGFVLTKRDNFVDGKGCNVVVLGNYYALEIMGYQSTNVATFSTTLNYNTTYLTTFSYNGNMSSSGMNLWVHW